MKKVWLAGATAVLLILLTMLRASAHGGGELVAGNTPVGAYKVSVWVNPPQPRADQVIHVTVGIAGENDAPVLDAQVTVTLRTAAGEAAATAAATTAQSVNRLFYEADLPRTAVGSYEAEVQVSGAGGQGIVTFPLQIRPSPAANWALIAVAGIGVAAAILLVWSRRSSTRKTAVVRRPPAANRR